MTWALLGLLGAGISTYATMVGTSGGFLLAPALLLLYPRDSVSLLTSISIAVVFAQSVSGSLAYAQQRRIDYRSSLLMALALVPGAALGAFATRFVPRAPFDVAFGMLLLGVAALVLFRPEPGITTGGWRPGYVRRILRTAGGVSFMYAYDWRVALAVHFVIGLVTNLFGAGGGVLMVPTLVYLLRFPAFIATGTSQFNLVMLGLVGMGIHFLGGEYTAGGRRMLALGIGVIVGAQVGARLSQHVKGPTLLRILAVGLVVVGLRLLLTPFVR